MGPKAFKSKVAKPKADSTFRDQYTAREKAREVLAKKDQVMTTNVIVPMHVGDLAQNEPIESFIKNALALRSIELPEDVEREVTAVIAAQIPVSLERALITPVATMTAIIQHAARYDGLTYLFNVLAHIERAEVDGHNHITGLALGIHYNTIDLSRDNQSEPVQRG